MKMHDSVDRILSQANTFADLFYLVFLQERYPELQKFFQKVDMQRQSVLLTMSLIVMERHYRHEYPTTSAYLRNLGADHEQRGISKDAYPKFRQALLDTLERFHSKDWNEGMARQWSDAIDRAIEAMLQGYRR